MNNPEFNSSEGLSIKKNPLVFLIVILTVVGSSFFLWKLSNKLDVFMMIMIRVFVIVFCLYLVMMIINQLPNNKFRKILEFIFGVPLWIIKSLMNIAYSIGAIIFAMIIIFAIQLILFLFAEKYLHINLGNFKIYYFLVIKFNKEPLYKNVCS